jgi:hypothetical protein
MRLPETAIAELVNFCIRKALLTRTVSNFDSICRLAQDEPTPDVNAQIDRHKAAAVEILRAMAAAIGTTYPLPPNGHLGEAVYWDLSEADMPPQTKRSSIRSRLLYSARYD